MDNDSAFLGKLSAVGYLGRFTLFLLNLGVVPLHVAQRCPRNNGNVEGFNSVFSKKFWNKLKFKNENEINVAIKKFNIEYELYSELIENNPEIGETRLLKDSDIDFKNTDVRKFRQTKMYFLRIIRRIGTKGEKDETGYINILGREISIDKQYINLFTLFLIHSRSLTRRKNVQKSSARHAAQK